MKTAIIKFSDIAKHPTNRMDAEYHVGKKEGKKAYKKGENGLLKEDDINGKSLLTEAEAEIYNETTEKIKDLNRTIARLKEKIK
jgi:hypothetical protein